MNPAPAAEALLRDLCCLLAAHAEETTLQQRVDAALLVLHGFGVEAAGVEVRAAAFSRSSVFRLGGAALPNGRAEIEQFREQVGPGMILLDALRQHRIVVARGFMIELAHSTNWHDYGVLLRPFVEPIDHAKPQWVIERLRFGVHVAYERRDRQAMPTTPDRTAHRLAEQVTWALRPLHDHSEDAALGA